MSTGIARTERNWRNILFLSGTFLGSLTLIPLYVATNGWSWPMFTLLLAFAALSSLSITAGYHRLFAHRSYEARPLVQIAYLIFGASAFQGSALEWCADHRRHHSHVDTDKDPHNINEGFFWAHVGWLFWKTPKEFAGRYPTDLKENRWVMWQERHYVTIAMASGFGLPALVGWALLGDAWGGFLWGGVLRTCLTNHSTFLINSLAHTLGTKPFSKTQTARDSIVMAFLAYGEGYHNFHHQFSFDYRNGVRWFDWDPTKWLIGSLAGVRLASRLKKVPASEIVLARIRTQQDALLERGISEERIRLFRERLETAQQRWGVLVEDYRSRKKLVAAQGRQRLAEVKAELRVARLEFRHAVAQWAAYYRTLRGVPAVQTYASRPLPRP